MGPSLASIYSKVYTVALNTLSAVDQRLKAVYFEKLSTIPSDKSWVRASDLILFILESFTFLYLCIEKILVRCPCNP